MLTGLAMLIVMVAAAIALAITLWSRRLGGMLIVFGVIVLAHAGVTMLWICLRGGLDLEYEWMNFRMLFATVPVGLLLVIGGTVTACMTRLCATRDRGGKE